MKANPILSIKESMWDCYVVRTEIVLEYDPKTEVYSITLGREDGEGEHKTIDLTPDEFDLIRRFNA